MKRLIASTLLATATFTGVAQALPGPTLSGEPGHVLPGADFSTLSPAQIDAIYTLARFGDSQGHPRANTQAER